MRNYLYLFLVLLLGGGSSLAQTAVTTASGQTFHLGDSLTIGLPHTPGERYKTMGWTKGDMKIPAFAKGKLKRHIIRPKKDMFGDIITEPDTLYFLSLPQYPKDSLVVYLGEAVQKGEIVTAQVEHTPLYPEAVELLPQDYVPALIKAGYTTYTDVAIKAYAQSLGNGESSNSATNNPFEYQRQQASLLEKLKEAVEKFDLNQVYYLRSQFHTNVYDFTRSGYPAYHSIGYILNHIGIPAEESITLYPTTKKSVYFVGVPANRAETFEKRAGSLGSPLHVIYGKTYIRLLPAQDYVEDGSRLYNVQVDYLGLDLYEYPHCAYYHLGSSKAE